MEAEWLMIGDKFCFDLFPTGSVPDSFVREFICLFIHLFILKSSMKHILCAR